MSDATRQVIDLATEALDLVKKFAQHYELRNELEQCLQKCTIHDLEDS